MGLFTGEYHCKIDGKGRLSLPAKLRANLPIPYQNEIVLRRSSETCLILYTQIGFQKLSSKLSSLNEFDPKQRRLQRSFFGSVAEVALDGAGRALLPKKMLEHAGLEKDALLVGLGDRMEIWSPSVFEAREEDDFEGLAQEFLL